VEFQKIAIRERFSPLRNFDSSAEPEMVGKSVNREGESRKAEELVPSGIAKTRNLFVNLPAGVSGVSGVSRPLWGCPLSVKMGYIRRDGK
jgi:hypothetical protein